MNFILKPQLERRRGYKLFLDDRDLLPRAGIPGPAHPEGPPHWALPRGPAPTIGPRPQRPRPPHRTWSPAPFPAHQEPRLHHELRPTDQGPAPGPDLRRPPSRRALRRPPGEPEPLPPPHRGAFGRLPEPGLVQPQLPVGPARGWVGPSLAPTPLTVPPRREGLCRLLELTRRPIFITFEGQRRDPAHPALRLLRQHRHLVTLLLWRPGSVVRSRRGGAGASGGLEMGGARAPGGDPSVGSSAAPHFLNGPWGEVPLPGTPMRGAALEGPGAAE